MAQHSAMFFLLVFPVGYYVHLILAAGVNHTFPSYD